MNIESPRFYNKFSFKGTNKTNKDNNYYKSYVGTTIGTVIALPFVLGSIKPENLEDIKNNINNPRTETDKKSAENVLKILKYKTKEDYLNNVEKNMKNFKKFIIPISIAAVGSRLGAGILVDHIRNKEAKETADIIKTKDKNLIYNNKKIDYNDENKPYYKTNVGAKLGTLLGAICGITAPLYAIKSNHSKQAVTFITSIILNAIAGFFVGKLSDHITNKNAQKHA